MIAVLQGNLRFGTLVRRDETGAKDEDRLRQLRGQILDR